PVRSQTPDDELPFLDENEVRKRKQSTSEGKLWIVIDNIVYDCSIFANLHPSGADVIESLRGEDCSWQFWRFHDNTIMRKWGRPLRVGRTKGVQNRFREVPRFVG
ncbi:cytochrome b5, partial [Colletotrichum somersetense]